MKHIPMLSFLSATLCSPRERARALTCPLVASPSGKRVRCRAACPTWLRKKLWSLTGSTPRSSSTLPSGRLRIRA
uniref:Putative secreted protein n=1 Tax=Ixodes ricinus TaxID=34613 RepID=A0A6B0U3J2_IXORI